MLQNVQKWRVIVYFDASPRTDVGKYIQFVIFDNHLSNVLEKIRAITFDDEPSKIEIFKIS